MGNWRSFRDDIEGDDPPTEDTLDAWAVAKSAAERQLADFDHGFFGPQMRIHIRSRGYTAVVLGQRSATANGKQGLHPKRLEELREIGEPFWLVFIDGSTVWSCWPHALGPELTENIANDTARRRQGWKCEDLTKRTLLEFPRADEIPPEPESLFTI